jgi:uncharacterized protein DUF6152
MDGAQFSQAMNNRVLAFAAAVCVVTLSGPLSAHHGASAYDRARPVSLKATITEFRWTNPHTYILFDAPDGQGKIEHWSCESINPGMLSKQGWTRRTLSAGDTVTIIGYQSRTGSKVMLLEKLVLPNGKELAPRLLD